MQQQQFKIGDLVEYKFPRGRVIGFDDLNRHERALKVMRDDTGEVIVLSPNDAQLIEHGYESRVAQEPLKHTTFG
jgi:hypothetical protein